MLNIAICESDPNTRSLSKTLIDEAAASYAVPYAISECASFEQMDILLTDKAYQVLLIATDINGEFGIDYAKKLRAGGYKSVIMFISDSGKYAVDSFDVNAFFYFLKPPERERFKFVFNRLFNFMASKTDKTVTLKYNNEYFTYKLSTIVYVDSEAHKINIHFTNGDVCSYFMKLDDIEKLIASEAFIRIHKSYLVNYKFISVLTPTFATVNGLDLPVSRALKSEASDKYKRLTRQAN